MLARMFCSLVLLAITGQSALAQTICNNSPDLCKRQYNNITYLGAHDSPFLRDESTGWSLAGNQYFNTTTQLSAGVRLLTAQVQAPDGTGDLHVCHSSCLLLDAGTLSGWLREIKAWMDTNPNEVVTILLVNGAGANASRFATEYASSGLDQYSYIPSSKSATSDWPTLASLIRNGTRAINFVAELEDNDAAPFLMNEFDYVFENSYENTSPSGYSCRVDRPASVAGEASRAISQGYMSLQNHFLYEELLFGVQTPNESYIGTTNAASGGAGNLGSAALNCTSEYGKAPTFLLVDFFNVGPAIAVADSLNMLTSTSGRQSVIATTPSRGAATSSDPSAGAMLAVALGTFAATMLVF